MAPLTPLLNPVRQRRNPGRNLSCRISSRSAQEAAARQSAAAMHVARQHRRSDYGSGGSRPVQSARSGRHMLARAEENSAASKLARRSGAELAGRRCCEVVRAINVLPVPAGASVKPSGGPSGGLSAREQVAARTESRRGRRYTAEKLRRARRNIPCRRPNRFPRSPDRDRRQFLLAARDVSRPSATVAPPGCGNTRAQPGTICPSFGQSAQGIIIQSVVRRKTRAASTATTSRHDAASASTAVLRRPIRTRSRGVDAEVPRGNRPPAMRPAVACKMLADQDVLLKY